MEVKDEVLPKQNAPLYFKTLKEQPVPIPFAELSSDNPGNVWNLQLHFWRNAIEHFEEIQDAWDDYESGEAFIEVDACMVIVLAGTSVSQLLGQQHHGPGMPAPRRLFKEKTNGVDLAAIGISPNLTAGFDDFMDTYDALRHFGEPKHAKIRAITEKRLCEILTTAQEVWRAVAIIGGYNPMPNDADFQHRFVLPK